MLIDLPAVSSAGAPSLSGSLIFGIGTQSNNQPSGTVLTTDSSGYITTLLAGKTCLNHQQLYRLGLEWLVF